MQLVRGIVSGIVGVIISAGIASASTISFTEGARPQVAGTTPVIDNADDTLPGYNLGALSSSGLNTINLYGRIETSQDIYQFTATSPFVVQFIFSGYDLMAGGTISASGFVADPSVPGDPGNTSDFKLRITAPSDTLLDDVVRTTPYTSGNSFIASATEPGTYRFRIDGGGAGGAAYYDISITTTPLPATLPLFASGLGVIALLARNRKQKKKTNDAACQARPVDQKTAALRLSFLDKDFSAIRICGNPTHRALKLRTALGHLR